MLAKYPVLLVTIAVLTVGCQRNSIDTALDFRVQAIGCLLPIPAHYVLNTNYENEYVFYDASGRGFGRIRIDDFDKDEFDELLENGEILARIEEQGRVAIRISMQMEGSAPEGFATAIYYDNDQIVTIVGDEVSNWRSRFQACVASPTADKLEPDTKHVSDAESTGADGYGRGPS